MPIFLIKNIQFSKYHIYADDVQIYISFNPSNTCEAINKLNSDLSRIAAWSDSHSLVLNSEKTKYMILGTLNMIQKVEQLDFNIKIKDTKIDRVKEAKNLGVIFEENLRFEKYIGKIVSNCFYRLKTLYRIRKYLNENMRVRLCDTLVLSKLNYADIMYGPRLLNRTKNAIQRVQNACARFCWDIPARAHITPYLIKANILKMENRRRLHLASALFDIIITKAPVYLYHKLSWLSEFNTQYPTRASLHGLTIQRHHTAAFRGSFTYSATKCWNDLPPPIRNLKTINSFKVKFKKYLLNLQRQELITGFSCAGGRGETY